MRGVEPKTGAFATEDRNHTNGGLNNRGDDAEERYREGSGVTSGNPICEPIFVNGAEPGDTLQVELLELRTADWGWTGGIPTPNPAHCLSAFFARFAPFFPPSLCVARLPGAETERTGEKWRKMGEIWGRNGRETAVAEWRWGQLLHQPSEWGWKVSAWLAYMALLLATPRKHIWPPRICFRLNGLASNAQRLDWLLSPGRAAAAVVVCHGARALLRPPRGPCGGARAARAGAGGAGAGGAAAIPTPVSRSNLCAPAAVLPESSLKALAGLGCPGWRTQRSARWACTGAGGSPTACAARRRRPRTEPWR